MTQVPAGGRPAYRPAAPPWRRDDVTAAVRSLAHLALAHVDRELAAFPADSVPTCSYGSAGLDKAGDPLRDPRWT